MELLNAIKDRGNCRLLNHSVLHTRAPLFVSFKSLKITENAPRFNYERHSEADLVIFVRIKCSTPELFFKAISSVNWPDGE